MGQCVLPGLFVKVQSAIQRFDDAKQRGLCFLHVANRLGPACRQGWRCRGGRQGPHRYLHRLHRLGGSVVSTSIQLHRDFNNWHRVLNLNVAWDVEAIGEMDAVAAQRSGKAIGQLVPSMCEFSRQQCASPRLASIGAIKITMADQAWRQLVQHADLTATVSPAPLHSVRSPSNQQVVTL